MLHGREVELARMGEVLQAAREGRSAALVLSGEPGIGKTALLDAAEERAATDLQVLRTRGFESERELPFAGLYGLLAPVLDLREHIPPAQARALGTALALEPPAPHDPFAVPAAVLSMLAAAAERRPVLVIADDLQWLDEASQRAVIFAARRLGAEGIAILLACRADEPLVLASLDGLPLLPVGVLDDRSAHALVRDAAPGGLADSVAAQLVRTAGGNPLALRELSAALTAAQRTGVEPPLLRLPPGSAVERGFRQRFTGLDQDVRRAVTVVAALESGPTALALAALERMGLGVGQLEVAEQAGLLRLRDGEVGFRHPLLRSLAYHAATSSALLAAHRALAEVAPDPSARAWHLSAAAIGPDEKVARALDEAADIARCRGASSEAAAAAQRAAELSARSRDAVRRLTLAAGDLAVAGRADQALAVIERATGFDPEDDQQAALRVLRGRVDVRRGAVADGRQVLFAEGDRLAADDPVAAGLLLAEAGVADITLGSTQRMLEDAGRIRGLAAGRDRDLELLGVLLEALALVPVGRAKEAVPLLKRSAPLLLGADPHVFATEILSFGAQVAMWLEHYDVAEAVLDRQIAALRAASAIGRLPFALSVRAHLGFRLGRWSQALADAAEAVALARQTGQPPQVAFGLSALSLVESARGRTEDALAHAREAHAIVDQVGGGPLRMYSASALGFASLIAENLTDALDHLRLAAETVEALGGREPAMMQFDGDLVELLARLGHREEAERRLASLSEAARTTGRCWARGVVARVRGQLAPEGAFAQHFEEALAWQVKDRQPLMAARTRLAYGQRLRRAGERTAARRQLTQAAEELGRLGAAAWVEQAQAELRASGQTLRRRSLPASEELTPSELQVALRVAEGLTNREVAAAIFLSPKTVEHHLSAIYRKLGIRSRTELARRMADLDPGAALA